MFFRFQQKRKEDFVELVVDADEGNNDASSATAAAAASVTSPAASVSSSNKKSEKAYQSPHRYGPGQPYVVTGIKLVLVGWAAIVLGAAYIICYRMFDLYSALYGWTFLLGITSFLAIAGGALTIALGSFYQVMGLFFNREQLRPSGVVSYMMSAMPWVILLLTTTVTPGYIGPLLYHAYPLVAGVYIWNLIGLYLMLRARNLGIWILQFLIFILPSIMVPMVGPAVITIMQALGPVFR